MPLEPNSKYSTLKQEIEWLHELSEKDILKFVKDELHIDATEVIGIYVYPTNKWFAHNYFYIKLKKPNGKTTFSVFAFHETTEKYGQLRAVFRHEYEDIYGNGHDTGEPVEYTGKEILKKFRELFAEHGISIEQAKKMLVVWGSV